MVEKKTTSIKVDPILWKEFKKFCIDKNIDISGYLEILIKKELKKR